MESNKSVDKQEFHPLFLENFTQDELDDLAENYFCIGYDCIVIITDKYFFELSADVGAELDIYYEETERDSVSEIVGGTLTKEEFMQLYQQS